MMNLKKALALTSAAAILIAPCAEAPKATAQNLDNMPPKVVYPNGKPAADAVMVIVFIDNATHAITTSTLRPDKGGKLVFPNSITEPANSTSLSYFKSPTGIGFDLNSNPQAQTYITLHPFTSLRVHLIDASGKPVAHVKIGPNLFTGSPVVQSWDKTIPGPWTQATDANGWATLHQLPQGLDVNLGLVSDTLVTQDGNVHLASAAVTPALTVHVVQASSISGCVLYGASQKPVAGIQVTTTATEADGALHRTTTDKDGNYTIAGLTEGNYGLEAVEDDAKFKGWLPFPQGIHIAPAAQITGIDLSIVRAGIVKGKVTDKDGKPVAHVDVTAWATGVATGYADNTGDDGSYTMQIVPGKAAIEVMTGNPASNAKTVNVIAGKTIKIDFKIDSP